MEIILVLGLLFLMLIPYLIGGIVVSMLIWLIRTKLITTTFKILILIIILLFIFLILINIYHEKPNDLYLKMNEMNDSQRLIGLSEEQVIERLGEPRKVHTYHDINKDVYLYHAGHLFREIFLGKYTIWAKTDWYVFSINFDETDKVESTSITKSLELVI